MLFKSAQIVEFAIGIEKNGEAFYQALAQKLTDPATRQAVESLAKAESQHIIDFQAVRDRLGDYDIPEQYPGEYEAYVKVLIDENVFGKAPEIEKLVAQVPSDVEALNLAIRFEKESILFFTELMRLVSNTDRQPIWELIRQEQEHILKLVELKNKL